MQRAQWTEVYLKLIKYRCQDVPSWSTFYFHIASLFPPARPFRDATIHRLSSRKSDEKQRQIAYVVSFYTINAMLHWNRCNCVVSIVSVVPWFTHRHFFRDFPVISRQPTWSRPKHQAKCIHWGKSYDLGGRIYIFCRWKAGFAKSPKIMWLFGETWRDIKSQKPMQNVKMKITLQLPYFPASDHSISPKLH